MFEIKIRHDSYDNKKYKIRKVLPPYPFLAITSFTQNYACTLPFCSLLQALKATPTSLTGHRPSFRLIT